MPSGPRVKSAALYVRLRIAVIVYLFSMCAYTITQLHRHMRGVFMRFTDLKSETLNLRVSRKFKQALKEAAEHEQRSMVNMLEVLLCDYCDRKGIVLPSSEASHELGQERAVTGRKKNVGVSI